MPNSQHELIFDTASSLNMTVIFSLIDFWICNLVNNGKFYFIIVVLIFDKNEIYIDWTNILVLKIIFRNLSMTLRSNCHNSTYYSHTFLNDKDSTAIRSIFSIAISYVQEAHTLHKTFLFSDSRVSIWVWFFRSTLKRLP